MSDSIAILGRQPALGMAELERLYGAEALQPTQQPEALLLKLSTSEVAFNRLGGAVKLAKHLATVDGASWPAVIKHLVKNMSEYLSDIPEGKIRFGLSVHGLRVSPAEINRSALELKKIIKKAGRSVRVVPNTERELSSAQTLHNQLTGPTGLELLIVLDGSRVLIGQVTDVQNINAYAARDQVRPKRDARVGMLPPKLAQIIVNLTGVQPGQTVLDPFCGTGVILQESLLMGLQAIGTDLEARMIEYSQANLEWLDRGQATLDVGDATDYQWSDPFNAIAAETYLGRPFNALPDPAILKQVISDVSLIHKRFLQNVAKQTEPGLALCLAVPAWKTNQGFLHLPTLASLEEMGYTRMSFVHVGVEDLIYHRPGQIVGRELVVLTRK
jgi:tRNA G10  N-methylase Trm11